MLKIDLKPKGSALDDKARKAVLKEDCDVQINSRVPRRLATKLKIHLAENEVRQQAWLIEILENL